jgi:thiopeptide-type bacteriocin biosynthesis protein
MPWDALRALVEEGREQGRIERAFLMRKPPGLRLRFAGTALEERWLPPLVEWLEEMERRDAIRGFRFAVYEPEIYRFGGPAGMAIAHDHFDRDTRRVLQYETLADADRATLPRDLYSLVVTNDLFGRRAEDTAEMWDIWRRLEAVIGGASAPGAGVPDARQALRASLMLEPEFVAMLTPAAAELVSEAQADNVHVAARLRAEEVAGRLAVGPRSWLTSACVFHWNRLGLTTDALRPMVARMLDLLVDGAAT